MKKPINEEELLATQPVDKIDKNLRHIFGLLVEKDWKMAQNLIALMRGGNAEAQQLAEGFTELVDFMKVFSAGKEMKAAIRDLNSLSLDSELDNLLPETDDRESLKTDIESKGILTPLIIQETPDGLKLIDGYTRYRIAKEIGLKRVPVVSINPMLEPKMVALALNLIRRHMTKEARDAFIQKLPIPKAGRPKKEAKIDTNEIKELRGEKPTAVSISASKLAKELGIHERTVRRARKEKNDTISKPKKARRMAPTPPDQTPYKWISTKDLEIFREVGYLKGIGYFFDFTKDQIDLDLLVRQVDTGMGQLLKAMKDAGLEDQVEHYRMMITFECRKRGVEEE